VDTDRSKFDSMDDHQPADGPGSKSLTDEEVERLGELQEEFAERTRNSVSDDERSEVQDDIQKQLEQEGNPWADVWAHAAANGHTRRDAKYRVMLDWLNNWVTKANDDKQFGQFSDLQPLGSGAFGAVFRGYDNKRKGLVAIKLPHVPPKKMPSDWDTVCTSAQQHANFFEEARKHANIPAVAGCVALYASGMPDAFDIDQILVHLRTSPIWFSMQFINGKSLDHVLRKTPGGYKRGETIPDDQVIELMTKIAERLQNLHATPSPNGKGCIIHKDLKPANILLDQQNNPWLTDFGLASARFDQQVAGNPISGTEVYAAPEQFSGIEANEQTDIWAWGVIFHELLTGQLPFDGEDRICDDQSPVPKLGAARPDLPEYLESVIDKCLQRKRESRFGSFAAVLDDLRSATGMITRRRGSAADRLDPFGRIEDDLRDGFDRVESKVDLVHETLSTDREKQKEAVDRLIENGRDVGTKIDELGSKVDRIAAQSSKTGDRHSDEVVAAEFSPDGQLICTASDDWTARIWDARTGRMCFVLQHTDRVYSAKFSSDGTRIVTIGDDTTAKIWDVATGQSVTTYMGHSQSLWVGQFSPDGSQVLTAGDDGTARIWDAENGAERHALQGHRATIYCGAFSPKDRKHVVTVSRDKTVRLWEIGGSKVGMRVLKGHAHPVLYVAFSADGNCVATADDDGRAITWSVRSGKQIALCEGHGDSIWCVDFSPDSRRLVTTSSDNTARIWDASSGRELHRLRHKKVVEWARFSPDPDGSFLVTAGEDGVAKIWRMGKEVYEIWSLVGHDGPVWTAEFSPDGTRVVTAGRDRSARVWDARTGELLFIL